MAERRMFAKTIIDSDAFLDMPLTTQALYFHLSMRADDEGFINNPKKISRMIGASDDDLRLLVAKRFIIPFESGVVVIKHWKIHNYIQKDRFKQTVYQEERALLDLKDNGTYTLDTECIHDVSSLETQDSIELNKDIVNVSKENIYTDPASKKPVKHKYGEHQNVMLTDDEYQKLMERFPADYNEHINELSNGLALYGYKYKSHYLAILKWAEKNKQNKKVQRSEPQGDNIFLELGREEGLF